MKTEFSASVIKQQLGADRVLDPGGGFPQTAERLDPSGPVRPYEVEVDVERLCLDSTSHREIRQRADGDPARMAGRIRGIVESRGKMHNPATGSGGVLLGKVTAVGGRHESPPSIGERIVTLGSLTLTPLALDALNEVDPGSTQVEVSGTAYVSERAAWARVPDDLPDDAALAIYDVCAAASQTRALVPRGGTVYALGAGHAGKLALAAARDAGGGTTVAVDTDAREIDRTLGLGLCDIGVSSRSARSARRPRSRSGGGCTGRGPHRRRGQFQGLRAGGDPPDRRWRNRPLLLHVHELLGGRPGRRRDRVERPDDGWERLLPRSRRLRR